MGWTNPTTRTVGEVITAAKWNTDLTDNLNALPRVTHPHAGTTDLECWYPCGSATAGVLTTRSVAVNSMQATPFLPRRAGTIDRIAFEVTTGTVGNARVGIYATKTETNIYPGSLVVDGGNFTTDAAGVKAATISIALTNFLYWAVFVADVVVLCRAIPTGSASPLLGMASTLGADDFASLGVAQTYGALPATFPASATRNTGNPFGVFVRYAT